MFRVLFLISYFAVLIINGQLIAPNYSTQILCTDLIQNNELVEHISVKYRFNAIFEPEIVHAISEAETQILAKPLKSYNGFISAIIQAYAKHQHLKLSPDDVWLTIIQGVSAHINYNAEKFRHLFVEHEGTKEIWINGQDILTLQPNFTITGNWPEAVNRLVDEVDKIVQSFELKELIESNFTTTTPTIKTSSKIVLLDAFQKYFDYNVMMICGIPKITLTGTLEDWTSIPTKMSKLRGMGLELVWFDKLDPIIKKFIDTYNGIIDEAFWSTIATEQPYGCGQTLLTGWLKEFYPYNINRKPFTGIIDITNLPNGLVTAPFGTDINLKLQFVSGFVGAQQLDVKGEAVVSPVIAWAVGGFKEKKQQ